MGTLESAGRYLHTIRHLRLRQVAARLSRCFVIPGADRRPRPSVRAPRGELVPPVARAQEWLTPDRVRLLNVERSFSDRIDWAPAGVPRLWVYNLHYFSDLPWSAGRADRAWLADVVASWIDANPAGTRNAWDPYPTSLRILNWVKWLLQPEPERDNEDVLQSLAVQTRFLAKRLEFDIAANHLLANAVALTASGLFFGAGEGDRWLDHGLRLLRRELAEQILEDGGHFERSPMYHAIVLEQLLDILNIWRAFPDAGDGAAGLREELEAAVVRMLHWLETMTHPDGGIAFFNDATLCVAPSYGDLADYARRLGIDAATAGMPSTRHLKETGYFRLASDDGRTVVIFDAGRIGPDYQPGHGHCDALSFEVSRDGERVLVNSGVSTYEPGEQRLLERRTESHNSVRVDGREQCEVWGAHRCGRRLGILAASSSGSEAEAQHSGFCHLPGAPLHHRRLSVTGKAVTVTDGFDGAGEHSLEWFLHLHPGVSLREVAGGFELSRRGEPFAVLRVPAELRPSVEDGEWHPGFNVSVPNRRVTASWIGLIPCDLVLELRWL